MRASGVQWQRNGPRRTRAHSRPPGARVPEPGSPALGAWPRAGHSELKTGAVSTRADEKITQFPQNPIFKTASGVWLWVRRRNCARSRPQLPSGQGHGGTPRGWALHSPGGGAGPRVPPAGKGFTFALGTHGTRAKDPGEASSPGSGAGEGPLGAQTRGPVSLAFLSLCLGPQRSQPWPQQQEEPRGLALWDGNPPCDSRAHAPRHPVLGARGPGLARAGRS